MFTYIISSQAVLPSSDTMGLLGNRAIFAHVYVHYSLRTHWVSDWSESAQVGILGFCVDSRGEIAREDIAHFLLVNSGENVASVIKESARLAGKFVIFFANKSGIYIIPDATASLPVFYSTNTQGDSLCVSSSDHLVSLLCNYGISPRSLDIRLGSDLSQPLPNDITLYEKIRCLLPNHYVEALSGHVVRFAPLAMDLNAAETAGEVAAIVASTAERASAIVEEYTGHYDVVCPITSGWDSRLVLSLLLGHREEIECFTFKHPHFSSKTGDFIIPPKICAMVNLEHDFIDDLQAPESFVGGVRDIVGGFQSIGTVNLAYTYRRAFGDRALVTGDIAGQIGKSSLDKGLPIQFATGSYFMAKQHNYSKYARVETQKYLDSIKASGHYRYGFDLFAVENRCGRWAAQTSMIYSACGVTSLNLFNCRDIIESWMRIPRSQRASAAIHRGILDRIAPEMLTLPVNPTDSFGFLRNAVPTFLAATYAKYWLGRFQRTTTENRGLHSTRREGA